MENYKVLVYYPGKLGDYVNHLTQKAPDLILYPCNTEEEIGGHIAEVDILFVSTRFPTRFLEHARNARWVQVMGAGVEKFTKEINFPEDKFLSRVNAGFGYKIAEFVFAHLLALTQHVVTLDKHKQQKKWEQLKLDWLQGKHMGIAGLGAIGIEIAKKADCFDMTVSGWDLQRKEAPYCEQIYGVEELYTFLSQPDYVVISLPLTAETEALFGARAFQVMREDSYIINTARGPIINEKELITALKEKTIAGAILDVFEQEPLPSTSPLWEIQNVIIAPHHAGPSMPAEITDFFLENVERFTSGKVLNGSVDVSQGF
jgi:phosphoglycerate dehydrogenase-like enzyme